VTRPPRKPPERLRQPLSALGAHQPIDWHEWGDAAFRSAPPNPRHAPSSSIFAPSVATGATSSTRKLRERRNRQKIINEQFRRRKSRSRRAPRRRLPLPIRRQRHFRPGRLAAHRLFCFPTANPFLAAPIFRPTTKWAAPDSAAFFSPSPILTAISAPNSSAPPLPRRPPSHKRSLHWRTRRLRRACARTERLIDAIDKRRFLSLFRTLCSAVRIIKDVKAIVEKKRIAWRVCGLIGFQSLGNVPVDVQALNVRFAVGGACSSGFAEEQALRISIVRPDLRRRKSSSQDLPVVRHEKPIRL